MKNIHYHQSGAPPVVSICIPTWNRAGKLARKLRALEPLLGRDVELVVVDNGSSDETLRVMGDFKDRNPQANLSLWTNQVNLGADVNYLRALELGQGKWLWLNDDDELLDVGGIERLIAALSERQGVILLPIPPFQVEHVALPKTLDLREFMRPEFDRWGQALHQIGFFLLERDACVPFFRAAYANGIGNLHSYVSLSYGMLAGGLPIHVVDVPGLIRAAPDPIGEPPRWNRLAGHLAAWRASEQALPDHLRLARSRERRTRAGALVFGTMLQLAQGTRLPAGLLGWQLRRLPWYMAPAAIGLNMVSRMPRVASRAIGRVAVRVTGRTVLPDNDAYHGY